ncbi:Uma2 family endonuclease [Fontisphaera persica]|uniref:Uma2 family endonuclease n=1 Tax=Fontisphaera persica TaxID=2974023 RepID=UPI0024BF3573|nr:Uma2 family endonuclease [Fontisphaera persica]WCJ59743.1 Uma2 family endonuclease [Fontisphaera persica]
MNYYEEVVDGETLLRYPPGPRHELICERLHALVADALVGVTTSRLLEVRAPIELRPGTIVRPDITLIATATGKAWLIAEVVDSEDHRADTVVKKSLYEETRLPRLWMVDPRYDNVEVYHGSPYGMALRGILAGRERLTEALLPKLGVTIRDLFAD